VIIAMITPTNGMAAMTTLTNGNAAVIIDNWRRDHEFVIIASSGSKTNNTARYNTSTMGLVLRLALGLDTVKPAFLRLNSERRY